MRQTTLLAALGALSVLAITGCADDTDGGPSAGQISSIARPDYAFDEVRHVALTQTDTDAFEIVTVTAHVCTIGDTDCPDGSEELIVLGSHGFMPHDVHLYEPDTMLQPPDECLADGTYCLLSLSHCEFADAAAMNEAEHCVPEGQQFAAAGATLATGDHHECTDPAAELSRHVDLGCMRDNAEQIGTTTPDEETDS